MSKSTTPTEALDLKYCVKVVNKVLSEPWSEDEWYAGRTLTAGMMGESPHDVAAVYRRAGWRVQFLPAAAPDNYQFRVRPGTHHFGVRL